jgi:hypothetical protein
MMQITIARAAEVLATAIATANGHPDPADYASRVVDALPANVASTVIASEADGNAAPAQEA